MAKTISAQQTAFLRFELERGDAKRKKVALQELCAHYRRGESLSQQAREEIETRINGLILQDDQDPKVVRWGLNALARFGRIGSSRAYVEVALSKYAGEPEIEAAGVAALSHMYRGRVSDIEALQRIDPIIWKLAALQNTDPHKIDVSGFRIDIDHVAAPVLRLALITVGLNREIEHLFHPKHSNNTFVKLLGQHPDSIVQQYSVWSVIENRKLVFTDLGVSLDNVEELAPNVQSKVFQLVAERDPDIRRRLELTELGSFSPADEAREGLSKGVRTHYYDGLEGVTIPWFEQEKSRVVRGHLAEHFARFASRCGPYEDMALSINEGEPALRERLLLGAEGTPLYSKLRAYAAADLLSGFDHSDLGTAIRLAVPARRSVKKVLMLAASPLDASRVRLEAEQRDIKDRIRNMADPKVHLEFSIRTAARTKDILTAALGSDAKIFHFSGHGEPDGLVFETDNGMAVTVNGAALAGHVGSMAHLECVVLNACFSSDLANEFSKHAKFVVGCDGSIDDDAACIFSSAFYAAMAAGKSYDECFAAAKRDVEINHSKAESDRYLIQRR